MEVQDAIDKQISERKGSAKLVEISKDVEKGLINLNLKS
jgi:hypothetical protein